MKFHAMQFDDLDEAAAFIAALSRQIAGQLSFRREGDTEVAAVVRGSGAIVYLSGDAFAAAERAFGALPESRVTGRPPATSTPVITSGALEPFGRDDVLRKLR